MATIYPIRKRIRQLKEEFEVLKTGKESLLKIIDEAEIPESVYNSNSIENSTLTLKETEKILLEMEVSRNISVREIFEAKNLAHIIEYVRTKSRENELTSELILLLHQMLIGNINEIISGRFRQKDEYVRIGTHIGSPPEKIEELIREILTEYKYNSENEVYFLDKIAKFHLDFEAIHPFNDGNGRIGRVIINYQLSRLGFPVIIVRDKEKKGYYTAFNEYNDLRISKRMEKIIALGVMESLHKRITYLKGNKIENLTVYCKRAGKNVSSMLNSAKRQTIFAFREKGIWKISTDLIDSPPPAR